MTDQGTHVPTAQETAIYNALTAGDHDAIDQLRTDAYAADQTPPDPLPDGWLSPADQFDLDYAYAWSHYQADHEAPEPVRETLTQVDVHEENTAADPDSPTGLTLSSLAPFEVDQTTENNGDVRIYALGTGYSDQAKAVFGGQELATAVESETTAYFTVNAAPNGHAPGTFDVVVRQGAAETAALPFTIHVV